MKQRKTFKKEAELYQDFKIPAVIQNKEEFIASFSDFLYLKALSGDTLIGVIRGKSENNICNIGRFAVHPDFQNQGIGTKLIKELETYFSDVSAYELFTGILSKRNLYFYTKLGYGKVRESIINGRKVIVLAKKLLTNE